MSYAIPLVRGRGPERERWCVDHNTNDRAIRLLHLNRGRASLFRRAKGAGDTGLVNGGAAAGHGIHDTPTGLRMQEKRALCRNTQSDAQGWRSASRLRTDRPLISKTWAIASSALVKAGHLPRTAAHLALVGPGPLRRHSGLADRGNR